MFEAILNFVKASFNGFSQTPNNIEQYGQLGDFFGGIWGTVFAFFSTVFLIFTWRATRDQIRNISFYSSFEQFATSHDKICDRIHISNEDRDVFSDTLREFHHALKVVKNEFENDPDISTSDVINISYLFLFFGLHYQANSYFQRYNSEKIKSISDRLAIDRDRREPINNSFKGRQNFLGHYYRNLFNAYEFIDTANVKLIEKERHAKILRSKLSNYEQALLAVNIISDLGYEWRASGFVKKYMPIKNVPENFFNKKSAFDIKLIFPEVRFEWEKAK